MILQHRLNESVLGDEGFARKCRTFNVNLETAAAAACACAGGAGAGGVAAESGGG